MASWKRTGSGIVSAGDSEFMIVVIDRALDLDLDWARIVSC